MSIPRCIFAYTPPGADFPEYISINDVDGEIYVTVRSPKDGVPYGGPVARMKMPPEQLASLYKALFVEMIRLVQKGAV